MTDKVLKTFTVEAAGQKFRLHIEGEDGQGLELVATREQIDVIADTLDDLLAEDDSADEVEDEDLEDDEYHDDEDEKAPPHKP